MRENKEPNVKDLLLCIRDFLRQYDNNDAKYLSVIANDIVSLIERGEEIDELLLESFFLSLAGTIKRMYNRENG